MLMNDLIDKTLINNEGSSFTNQAWVFVNNHKTIRRGALLGAGGIFIIHTIPVSPIVTFVNRSCVKYILVGDNNTRRHSRFYSK